MIKSIFTIFWTLYALIIFIILGSLFFVVELVLIALGNLTYRAAHRWPAIMTKLILFLWGVRVKQHQTDLIKELPQCVILLNHRSDLDALVATAYMPDVYKFIGKQELVNYPFIGRLVEKLYITVDRKSKASRVQSLRNMKKQSNKGAHIVVFPEGWSNFSEEYLLELKRGAFKVALDLQLPILVCTLIGTHELFPKPKVRLSPGQVDLYWEKIISTIGMTYENDAEQIKEEVRNVFLERLEKKYPEGYPYLSNQDDFDTWMQKQLKKRS
jgi:1-acyl-sn-glycerol-3-phosphate acyltransferase